MRQRRVAGRAVRISLIWASIIGLIGCSPMATGLYNRDQGISRDASLFDLAVQYYRQGDYQHSLEQSLTLISQYPESALYDKALFYAALNNLHLGNPGGGYSMASAYFKRLVEECPTSPLQAESNTWIAILTSLSLKDKEIVALKKELEEKKTQLTLFQDEKAETMERLRQEMELKIKQLQRTKNREIARVKREMARLKKDLERLKNIDVQLEQRKKGIRK